MACGDDSSAVDAALVDASVDSADVGATGQCEGPADQAVFASGVDAADASGTCALDNIATPDQVDGCIVDATGLSSACAGCFGDNVRCIFDNCLLNCADPESDACVACQAEFCTAALAECSGLDLEGGGGEPNPLDNPPPIDPSLENPLAAVLADYETAYAEANPHDVLFAERDGARIAVRRFAASGAVSGPPMVLLHGFPDSQHLYDFVIPLLRSERDVISFDFLGWGASDKPDARTHDYDTDGMRADFEAVLALFEDEEEWVLVVHDAGGWPGIDWALDNPSRVSALVILNTVYHPTETAVAPTGLGQVGLPGPNRDMFTQEALNDFSFWLEGNGTPDFIGLRAQLDEFMNDEEADAILRPVLEAESFFMRPAFVELARRLSAEVAARGPAIPRMAAFDRPVSVVFGTDDPFLNPGVAADFTERFPRALRQDIDGAHHYVQVDAPAPVADAILTAHE
ncbi:MAG: alpha/beta hydrolase [Myxococcota bacterium]